MKKLFFLPIAAFMLLSGCEKQTEVVKPVSSTEQITNARSVGCPSYLVINGVTDTTFLSEVVNCPVYTCDGRESLYYTYKEPDPVFINNSSNLYSAEVDKIRLASNDVANKNMPKGCSGTIIPRYSYGSTFDNTTHTLKVFVTVNYYCCVYGQDS